MKKKNLNKLNLKTSVVSILDASVIVGGSKVCLQSAPNFPCDTDSNCPICDNNTGTGTGTGNTGHTTTTLVDPKSESICVESAQC